MSFGIKDVARIVSPAYAIGEQLTGTEQKAADSFFPKVDAYQAIMLLGLIKLSKTPEGLKVIEKIGTEFTKGIFKTLSFLGQASAANPVAAWANPILISGVLERFGFLPPRFNANYHLGITVISGVEIYSDILSDVADALPWNLMKGAPEQQYPTDVKFASTGDKETK